MQHNACLSLYKKWGSIANLVEFFINCNSSKHIGIRATSPLHFSP